MSPGYPGFTFSVTFYNMDFWIKDIRIKNVSSHLIFDISKGNAISGNDAEKKYNRLIRKEMTEDRPAAAAGNLNHQQG